MIERNPGVVRVAARDRRKQCGITPRDLIDRSALCDENVGRVPRHWHGERGLRWSHGHVSFQALIRRARNLCQRRDIPEAVDRVEVLAAVFAHDQLGRRSGHAYGRGDSRKGTWIGGVEDSCHR
jgi:hypothetical protein